MMKMICPRLLCLVLFSGFYAPVHTCSVLFYVDAQTGKVYAVNNEDYWYSVKPYIRIVPRHRSQLARVWYGWHGRAQGGVNEAGLFFDGAVSPGQELPAGYREPPTSLGDELLASCHSVQEAVDFLEQKKVALRKGHILFGDRSGHAAVVEWVKGTRQIIPIQNGVLMMTNFLLADTTQGNYPCRRYMAMEEGLQLLQGGTIGLRDVGNVLGKAVQLPARDSIGREGGTLYSSFIDLTDMQMVVVYKLDNTKITRLDLKAVMSGGKKRKIKLQE